MNLLYVLNRITRIVNWVLVKEIDEDTKIVIKKYWDKANKHPLILTKRGNKLHPHNKCDICTKNKSEGLLD